MEIILPEIIKVMKAIDYEIIQEMEYRKSGILKRQTEG